MNAWADRAGIDKTVLLIIDFGHAYPDQFDQLEKIYQLHREFIMMMLEIQQVSGRKVFDINTIGKLKTVGDLVTLSQS